MNPREWTPPGYYVESTDTPGTCGHCGAQKLDHTGRKLFCPAPPLEVSSPA